MAKTLLYITIFSFLISCAPKKSREEQTINTELENSKDSVINWSKVQYLNDPCRETEITLDSNFNYDSTSFKIRIKYECLADNKINDSTLVQFEDKKGDFIVLYNNYKYVIEIKNDEKNLNVDFKKELLIDSLSKNFVNNTLLGTTNFKEYTNNTFVFWGFIGYPDSDDGWMFDFSVNKQGEIKILKTYEPE